MEPAVDVLGYLDDLLLLQGLADLDQFRRMPLEHGLVDVARIRKAHDDVPSSFLGKHLERLGHVDLLGQPRGVVPVGHAQQQSVVIALQPPHLEVAGRRHERSVEIVDGVAQHVVVAVDLAAGLKQLHLVLESALLEDAHGLLRRRFAAAEGHVEVDDLLHPLADVADVVVAHRLARALLEVAVVAAAQRVLDEELGACEEVLRGLVEHEAQRADVGTVA